MTTTLHHAPDGVEVVRTVTEATRLDIEPLLVLDVIEEYFDAHNLGQGPISWKRIGEGQSNVTFLLERGTKQFVLRRGPRPPLPKSTHDMLREARIQQLIYHEGVPVPKIHAVCEDASLLGVPFYVMEFLDGEVITDTLPNTLTGPETKQALSKHLVDTLLQVHSVAITKPGIAELGRPHGYLERQVKRFGALWDVNSKRDMPQVARIGQQLEKTLPTTQRHALVHGDFRIGNLMFASIPPLKLKAIFDWEMATLGDPLADLGYMVATYATENSDPTVMELTSVTRQPGFWNRKDLVDYYAKQSGLDVSALPWYAALALWKSAIFCEAMYTRWLDGERPEDDEFGPALEAGVPELLDQAANYLMEL